MLYRTAGKCMINIFQETAGKKAIPTIRARLEGDIGEVTCKWFEQATSKFASVQGKKVFHLPVHHAYNINDEVLLSHVLTSVIITLDVRKGCWLLHPEDGVYIRKQLAEFIAHEQGTTRNHETGPWTKHTRSNHDARKGKGRLLLGVNLSYRS